MFVCISLLYIYFKISSETYMKQLAFQFIILWNLYILFEISTSVDNTVCRIIRQTNPIPFILVFCIRKGNVLSCICRWQTEIMILTALKKRKESNTVILQIKISKLECGYTLKIKLWNASGWSNSIIYQLNEVTSNF